MILSLTLSVHGSQISGYLIVLQLEKDQPQRLLIVQIMVDVPLKEFYGLPFGFNI